MCPIIPSLKVSPPFNSNAKVRCSKRRTVSNTRRCHTCVKRQYSQYRSGPQKFTTLLSPWERGFLFQDSDTVANASMRAFGEGASSWGTEKEESFNEISRQTKSGREVYILNRAQLFNMECAGNLRSIKHCFPFPSFISMQKKDPSVSTWGEKQRKCSWFLTKDFCIKDFHFFFKGKGEGNHLCHSKYTAGKSPPLKGRES